MSTEATFEGPNRYAAGPHQPYSYHIPSRRYQLNVACLLGRASERNLENNTLFENCTEMYSLFSKTVTVKIFDRDFEETSNLRHVLLIFTNLVKQK